MAYAPLDIDAPDSDIERITPGCSKLLVQIFNESVYITFGHGQPPTYDQPEPLSAVTGVLERSFDAFKVRAYLPKSQLPAGVAQAHVFLTPVI